LHSLVGARARLCLGHISEARAMCTKINGNVVAKARCCDVGAHDDLCTAARQTPRGECVGSLHCVPECPLLICLLAMWKRSSDLDTLEDEPQARIVARLAFIASRLPNHLRSCRMLLASMLAFRCFRALVGSARPEEHPAPSRADSFTESDDSMWNIDGSLSQKPRYSQVAQGHPAQSWPLTDAPAGPFQPGPAPAPNKLTDIIQGYLREDAAARASL
jgi:hypothetical protein